ncbi:putative enoyl CoA hydratase [Perkinsus chesapeaki]|uniref:Putative enoyl CoA hydratase n=1 Tax=Perkinsus chesapeaki TaxID=330153 RepID=A0A7J6MJB7_PERCH|nr:putative enoyl CoA hydratase [Perkinsus chesapeaki]
MYGNFPGFYIMAEYNYETLQVELKSDINVLHVALNRPKRINAFNYQMWFDIRDCFTKVNNDDRVRCVLLSGNGPKGFTAGLDLGDPSLASIFSASTDSGDADFPRLALKAGRTIMELQECLASVRKCRVPVVAAAHGIAYGAAIDLLSQVDIRIASPNVRFSIREVLVGMAADVGTLQFFPLICGNDSAVRELCYTGREFGADEAKAIGFVSKVEEDPVGAALKMCESIASNSPVAVVGTKHILEFSREAQTALQLKHNAVWNQAMILSSKDMAATINRPERAMSVLSQQTCGALELLSEQLIGIEKEVHKVETDLRSGELTPERAQHVLAQIEAGLDKLQFNGIDEIETGNLHSGKETAKHFRKELVKRAESLSQRIESIFRYLHEQA